MRWTATVDGTEVVAEIEANATLAEALQLAGVVAVKIACAEGTCGACSVLVDGHRRLSCVAPAMRLLGARLQTAASLSDGPIAAALVASGGLHCGFCTPGMVVALHDLAQAARPPKSVEELRQRLDANICRCTGYSQLLQGGLAGIDAMIRQKGQQT